MFYVKIKEKRNLEMVVKRDCIFTAVGKNRPLHIYLPNNYYETDERYPVMYFFDGHNLFFDEDATYGKSWGLKEFLDHWHKPMIIVGMECGREGEERLSEYLPYPATGNFSRFEPTGDRTYKWILEEVKPMIDREFRTIPFRECTGIAGSSMGGIMALYGVVHYNRWFSKAACVSSALGMCMDPLMKDMYDHLLDADTRVYLSWGTKEAFGIEDVNREDTSSKTYRWNNRVAKKIEHYGAKARLRCQVGGSHCEADWEKLVPEFMSFLWLED